MNVYRCTVGTGAVLTDDLVGLVVCQTLRTADGERVLFHKGHILTPPDLPRLGQMADMVIPLLEMEASDMHEDDAARLLATAVVGQGVHLDGPMQGRMNVRADQRGCLCINVEALAAMNMVPLVCLFSLYDGQAVLARQIVAGAKVMPLVVPRTHVCQASALAEQARQTGQPVIAVRPFLPQRVGVIVTDRVHGRARETFAHALKRKMDWFGAHVLAIRDVPDDAGAVSAALQQMQGDGATLLCTAGANAANPDDGILTAVREMGATMEHEGAPAHPGTLFWLAYLHDVPMFGLPLCGMFSQETVADLVLPRLMAGVRVTHRQIAGLGHGGLFTGGMAFRFPPYSHTIWEEESS